jgi:TolB-like protein/Tfp pilus assembly protein PilF
MVAVLPFENLSGDASQEYFSDGLTEQTITDLSSIASDRMGVIARTSAMTYKRTRKNIAEICRELDVQYALEGSVRRDGSRVRISVQLIRAHDQTHLWAQNFDRELIDVLTVQEELGRAIAEQVRVKLSPRKREQAAGAAPLNFDAYDAYLRGRYYLNRLTPPNTQRAIEFFTRATEIDPRCAVAYGALAESYVVLPITGDAPSGEAIAKAKRAARQALAIDPNLAEAHTAIGFAQFWHDWDWAASEESYRRAIALNANYSWARDRYAHLLSNTGRHEEAMVQNEIAHKLDPFSLIINTMCGQFRYQAGQFSAAIAPLAKCIALDPPDFWVAHLNLSKVHAAMGNFPEALAEAHKAEAFCDGGSTEPLSLIGHALAALGRRAEAEMVLETMFTRAAERYVPPYNVALVYLGLKEYETALEWLERAWRERDVHMVFLKVEPKWDPVRNHPRFLAVLERCGLAGFSQNGAPAANRATVRVAQRLSA